MKKVLICGEGRKTVRELMAIRYKHHEKTFLPDEPTKEELTKEELSNYTDNMNKMWFK